MFEPSQNDTFIIAFVIGCKIIVLINGFNIIFLYICSVFGLYSGIPSKVSVCKCANVYSCVFVWVHTCVWRLEINLKYYSSSSVYLGF